MTTHHRSIHRTLATRQDVPGDRTARECNTGVHDVLDKKKGPYKSVSEQASTATSGCRPPRIS